MNPRDSNRATALSEEAAHWFVRLKDDDLSATERRQYLEWLKQAPAHVAEMLRVTGVYGALRGARLKQSITLEDGEPNVVEWENREQATAQIADRAARGRNWRIAAVFAAVALAGVLAVSMPFSGFESSIETGASEWRRLTLEDGSLVRLGPRTRLQLRFEDGWRSVELLRGEATFQVARDPLRPFVVNAGLAQVRAVGTAFGVERQTGQVIVTVSEGAVAVSQSGQSGRRTESRPAGAGPVGRDGASQSIVAVAAGEQVAVSRTRTASVRKVDVARALAWAEGRLIFDNETLAQAVNEFNRRNRLQIEVKDAALAGLPVRGVFDAADAESFVDFLVAAGDIEAIRTRGNEWVLKKKGDESGR